MKALWDGIVSWVTNNQIIVWIGAGLLFALGLKKIIEDIKKEAKHAERAATAVKQAEVKVRVTERSNEIINEERKHADAALEARDSGPLYPSAAVVPNAIARVGFRREGGG